jgi:hypothetical protein
MVSLNAILTKNYAMPLSAAVPAAPARPAADQVRPAGGREDRFAPGQYWRNRAVGEKGAAAAADCRCGNCALCAVRAYTSQEALAPAAAAKEQQDARPAGDGMTAEAQTAGEKTEKTPADSDAAADPVRAKGPDGEPLDREELALLLELKKTDAAVRAHEQAHLAAAGGLAKGGASFVYEKGPDGREYAVAGEVQIDTSRGATPEETMTRMARVRAAALAPANPSPQDRKVARAAAAAMTEARLELQQPARPAPETQQAEGAAETAPAAGDGAATQNLSTGGGTPQRKSGITARAVSSYLAREESHSQGIFHRAA